MNRTIWIVRILGVAALLVMSLLMLNLYTKLRRMSAGERAPVAAPRTP